MPRKAIDRGRCFLFYPADYLSDPAVLKMTLCGRGAYGGALLYNLWLQPEPGVVEANDRLLAALAFCTPDEWASVKDEVAAAFDVTTRTGFWIQKRMVAEYAEQCRVIKAKIKAGKASAKARWGNNLDGEQTNNSRVTPAQQSDTGSGSGSGSGESVAEATLNPTASAAGLVGSLTRSKPNGNGTPRQRGTNSRAQGTNPRAQGTNPRAGRPWRPRRWYGTPRTEKLPAWYTPPGPLSLSSGGHTGIELPEPDVWRELSSDEMRLWQAAMAHAEPE